MARLSHYFDFRNISLLNIFKFHIDSRSKTAKFSTKWIFLDLVIRFYLKYIDLNKRKIEKQRHTLLPHCQSTMRSQFENLVFYNRDENTENS